MHASKLAVRNGPKPELSKKIWDMYS